MSLRSSWLKFAACLAWLGFVIAIATPPALAQHDSPDLPPWSNLSSDGGHAIASARTLVASGSRFRPSKVTEKPSGMLDANPTLSITGPTSMALWVFRFGAFTVNLHNNNPVATKFKLAVSCPGMYDCNPAFYDTITVAANGNATVYANFVTGATPATNYTVTLTASYVGAGSITYQNSVSGTVTVPSGPVVTPKNGSVIAEPGTNTTVRFNVASNPTSAGGTFDPETPSCGGWTCSLSGSSTQVAANASGYIDVVVASPQTAGGPAVPAHAVRVGATARGSGGPIANDSGTVWVTLAYHTPTLSPRTGSVSVSTAASRTDKFVLKNNGNSAATYDLAATCGAFTSCSASASSVTLGAGDTTTVSVSYAALQATQATIQLIANVRISGYMPAATDTARLVVTTTDMLAPTLTISPGDNAIVNTRLATVTVSVCDPDGVVSEPFASLNSALVLGTYTSATKPGCATAGSAVFELELEPGSNTFFAGTGDGYHITSVSQTLIYDETAEQKPVVTTALPSVVLKDGQTRVDSFTVRNPGALFSEYAVSVSCAAQLTACSIPVSSVRLASGQSAVVPISFTTTAASGVWPITLTASYTGVNSTTVSTAATSLVSVDVQAPSIAISPADDAALSEPPTIVVQWCDPDGTFASRHVRLDGTLLADNFTSLSITGCTAAGTSTWASVSIAPGTHTIVADATDAVGHLTTVSSTFTTSVPSLMDYRPVVSPKDGMITSAVAASVSRYFTVRNAGIYLATYQLAPICPFVTCQLTRSMLTIAPGAVDSTRLTYIAPPVATMASVSLAATFNDGPGRVIADTGGVLASTMTQANMSIPQVIPGAAALVLAPNTSQSIYFGIKNTGTIAAEYLITCETFDAPFGWPSGKAYWINGQLKGCGATDHNLVHVDAQQTASVYVQPSTPSSGGLTGRVTLFVDNDPADGSHIGVAGHTQVTTPQYASDVAIAPAANLGRVDTVQVGTTHDIVFTILNSGSSSNTYHYGSPFAWAADCQGVAISCSIVSGPTANFTLSPSGTQSVTVRYTASGPLSSMNYVALTAYESTGRSAVGRVNIETVGGPSPGVSVSVVSGPSFVAPADTGTVLFRIKNTGPGTDSPSYTVSCAGVIRCTGDTTAHVLSLSMSGTQDIAVPFAALTGPGGTGSVKLAAISQVDPSMSAMAQHSIQSVVASPLSLDLSRGNPGESIVRSQCVAIAAGSGGAYECGDLRLVHTLPTTTTLGKARTPTLLYSSAHANPVSRIVMDVTVDPATCPSSVVAAVRFSANDTVQRSLFWTGTCGQVNTRRITLPIDRRSTGIYDYAAEVRTVGAASAHTVSDSGRLVVVNRSGSEFGEGWWLDGLEQLKSVPGHADELLWIGGDGSTRVFRRNPTDTLTYAGVRTLDRIEVVKRMTTGEFRRLLPNGAYVEFDQFMLHTKTVTGLGHTTRFYWSSDHMRLDSLTLPVPSTSSTRRTYQFVYEFGKLARVNAPKNGTQGRVTTVSRTTGTDDLRIADPSTPEVKYQYDNSGRIIRRVDRLGYLTRYTFDATASLLTRIGTYLNVTPTAGDSIVVSVCAAESSGLGACRAALVHPDSAQTVIDGPRDSVRTRFTTTRYGAPRRIVNALGYVTEIERGNPRWPLLPTLVTQPNGHQLGADYDGFGHLIHSVDYNPGDDCLNSTTTYSWDSKWDLVTGVTTQEQVHDTTAYDATYPRPLWTQHGNLSSRRVSFAYDDDTTKLVRSTSTEVPGLGSEYVSYDPELGNVAAIKSRAGHWTTHVRDGLGRDTLIATTIDSADKSRNESLSFSRLHQRMSYDLLDRMIDQWSTGKTYALGPDQTVLLHQEFDDEGHLTAVTRSSSGQGAMLDPMITRYGFDAIGRRIWEQSPDNKRDSTVFDRAGNVVRTRNRNGNIGTLTYDLLNRLKTRTTERTFTGPETFGHDTITQPQRHIDSTSFPKFSIGPDSGITIAGEAAEFWYDAVGNLVRAKNADADILRQYYPNGAVKTDTLKIRTYFGSDFTKHVYGLGYRYDRDGRRIAFDRGLADSLKYTYWAGSGELESVAGLARGIEANFEYDDAGRLSVTHGPGGITETRTYDDGDRLWRRTTVGASYYRWLGDVDPHTIFADTILYDGRGKQLSNSTLTDGAGYTYTGLGAVASSFTGRRLSGEDINEYFTTDPFGNTKERTIAGGSITSYTYDHATGRQIAANSGSVADTSVYDAAGNLIISGHTEKVRSVTRSYYGGDGKVHVVDRQIEHDAIAADAGVPDYLLEAFDEYRYDALGRRILKRTRRSCSPRCVSAIERYVWDGDDLLEEFRYPGKEGLPADSLERDYGAVFQADSTRFEEMGPIIVDTTYFPQYGRVLYTHVAGTDQPLFLERLEYGQDHEQWGAFGVMLHYNSRGVVDEGTMTDDGRSTAQRQVKAAWPGTDLSVFGERRFAPAQAGWFGSLPEAGQDASGYQYRRNRYYNPTTGRFTQEDPIGLAGGLNLYGFGGGDPVSYRDPFGLCPEGVQADSARATGNRQTTLWCADGSQEVRSGGSRAWRNNNPGNLRSSSLQAGTADGFAVFNTEAEGNEAMWRLLQSGRYQGLTLWELVNKYAPASDNNNTEAYMRAISSATGMGRDIRLSDLTETSMSALIRAMQQHEGRILGTVNIIPR